MEIATDHKMTAFVVQALDGSGPPHPVIVVMLARAFPEARALELTLALASAAEGLSSMIAGGAEQAHALYRLGTLVAVDTLVLEVRGRVEGGSVTATQLLKHWEDDAFFRA